MVSATGPYPALRQAMRDRKARAENLAVWSDRSVASIRDKMAGRTEWSLDEALKIKQGLQSEKTIEVLFRK